MSTRIRQAGEPKPRPRGDETGVLMADPPTMADIAERAGVSSMTVSRALRGDPAVSEQTRQRIETIADEIGYVLDRAAASFVSRRSGFVAAIVPSLNNSTFAETVRGATEALAGSGRQLLLGYSDYSIQNEDQIVQAMLMRRPEGIILTGGRHTERVRRLLSAGRIPIVETWDLPTQPLAHVVGFSNAAAMSALVHDLHGRGYRRIGFIGGTSNRDTRGADRRLGYAAALRELDLGEPRIVSFGHPPISMEQGGEALVKLLTEWPDTDAAVCVSDLSAFGALMECQRRGWQVPGRIALAGFGDFEVSRASHPRLTTISVDARRIGYESGLVLAEAIQARHARKDYPARRIKIPFRIVNRETT